MSLTCLKKPFTLHTNIDIHKVVFSFGQNSELRYTEWRGTLRGVHKESCSGILYTFQNTLHKITVEFLFKGAIFKNVAD